jgi:hypothetical protein
MNKLRPQPYRLKWPLTSSQVESLDAMLQILFREGRGNSETIVPAGGFSKAQVAARVSLHI